MFLLALLLAHASGGALERYGKVIRVPFPNDEVMLGLGGLVYDPTTEFWTATAESISGSSVTTAYPEAATPRFYRFQLDFGKHRIEHGSRTLSLPNASRCEPPSIVIPDRCRHRHDHLRQAGVRRGTK